MSEESVEVEAVIEGDNEDDDERFGDPMRFPVGTRVRTGATFSSRFHRDGAIAIVTGREWMSDVVRDDNGVIVSESDRESSYLVTYEDGVKGRHSFDQLELADADDGSQVALPFDGGPASKPALPQPANT